jgi:Tfp pilus assembly protein PilF
MKHSTTHFRLFLKAFIISLCFLAASAAAVDAAGDSETEGRRGRLKIDFKSKINFVAEGRKFLDKGNVKEALYNATYAVEGGCDQYDSYLLLADIYKASGDLKSEAYSLEYVIEHSPNDRLKKDAVTRLSSLNEKIKNLGIQRSAASVMKNPESVNRVLRLGHTFERFGAGDRAATQYEYADNLSEGLKSSKYAKIRLFLKEGKKSPAVAEVKNFFALASSDTAMVYLLAYNGFNLSEIKEYGYDGGGGLDMRKYNRTYADYHQEIGYQSYLAEKFDQARISILYALSYFKSNPRAHFVLGEIFYRKGMFREAGFHYNIAGEYMAAEYEISLKMAKSFVMSKQYERARVVLKELLKIFPESDEYASWLIKTGLTRAEVERLGYTDVKSPFYKKKKPSKALPAMQLQPGGPENLLRQPPPPGVSAPFYQAPPVPIQL